MRNPFEVTKAVDFDDSQIARQFVDYPGGGFRALADPASRMPQFLVGGKGGGRTHLMRSYAYSIRKNYDPKGMRRVIDDKFLGIYFRCSGLNANRFAGRGVNEDVWVAVFAFYMDIWLAEHLLNVLVELAEDPDFASVTQVASFNTAISDELPWLEVNPGEGIADIRLRVANARKAVDRAVNNAPMRRSLDVDVWSNPGVAIFEIARAAASSFEGLRDVAVTFLIDEYENLDQAQQKYFNTLLREKELPTTFLVGSRSWGIRTWETLSAGEVNKAGSEYELIDLEGSYSSSGNNYSDFCVSLIAKRLSDAGYGDWDDSAIRSWFGRQEPSELLSSMMTSTDDREESRVVGSFIERVGTGSTARSLTDVVRSAADLVAQQGVVHRIFQQWSDRGSLDAVDVDDLKLWVRAWDQANDVPELLNFRKIWNQDLAARVRRLYGLPQTYAGFDVLTHMSQYLPRSLLVGLKSLYKEMSFAGLRPFERGVPVAPELQGKAMVDAANWYAVNALPEGSGGEDVDRAVRRLASFMRRARFSDKPSEPGCNAFSTDLMGLAPEVVDILDSAVTHGLLIEVEGGRVERNNGSRHRKFQLHPMLSPLYDLPVYRRGTFSLKREELHAIISRDVTEQDYSSVIGRRLAKMSAPFGAVEAPKDGLF